MEQTLYFLFYRSKDNVFFGYSAGNDVMHLWSVVHKYEEGLV